MTTRPNGRDSDDVHRSGGNSKRAGPSKRSKPKKTKLSPRRAPAADAADSHPLNGFPPSASTANGTPWPAHILDGIAEGFIALHKDWRCAYLNQAATAFLKTTPDKVLGQVLWDALPGLRDSRFCQEVTRAGRKEGFTKVEDFYEPLGRWYQWRCHPTDDGFAILIHDATDHKKVEEAMLESRQVLEMAIEGSSAGIWRIDLRPGKPGYMPDYVYLSPQLKALLGFESSELPNSRSAWLDRIVPEDRPLLDQAARDHAEGRTDTYQVDYRIRHKDGGLRWLARRGKLYRDEFNRPLRWAGVDTDITDRKNAEEAVRRLQEQAERVAEQARWLARIPEENPNPVLRISNEHILLYRNPAAEKLCEYWACWQGQKVPPVVQEIIAEALAAGKVRNHEILCADRTIWLTVAPCPDEDYVNIHARDITERKRMAESLRQANERLQEQTEELEAANEELRVQQEELLAQTHELHKQREVLHASERTAWDRLAEIEAIYNSAHVGLCIFDRDLRYTRINERLAEINGIPASEHLGKTVRQIVPDLADTAEELAEGIFRTGAPVLNLEISGTTAAQPGVLRHWVEHWLPLKDEEDQVVAISVVAQEVTERKRAQEALQNANEQLQLQTEELQTANEELQLHREELEAANEELQTQQEELQTQTEELQSQSRELRESERRFRTMADAISQLAWIAKADGWIHWYNRRWYEYTGTTPAQMEGWGWKSVHDPVVLPAVMERWRASIAKGEPFEMVFPLRGADGRFRDFLTRGMPLKDEQGRVVQWFGTNTDISEQQASTELLETASRASSPRELTQSALEFFGKLSGCSAVGVRLKEGDDYPYYGQRGLSPEFLSVDNSLWTRDEAGNLVLDESGTPLLACMCGSVICGRTDPSQPFFTPAGSFWVNSTTEFLATTTDEDRLAKTRTICNHVGFESLALIPLRVGNETLGLLHLGDTQADRFTPEAIARHERLAGQLATVLGKLRAEEALRGANERIRTTLESIQDGFVAVGFDWKYTYVNEAGAKFLKRRVDQLVGVPVFEAWPEARGTIFETALRKTLEDRKPTDFEVYYPPLESWFECRCYPSADGASVFFNETTARKRAEEALVAAHRQIQSIIDNTPAIVYAFDLEERFVLANTALAELLNSTPEEMMGKRRHEFMPKEDADWHEANDRRVIEAGRALEFEEYNQLKGRSITWLTTKFPLRDAQGRIYAVAGISADVSERKKAEQTLQESEQRLRLALEGGRMGLWEWEIETDRSFWDERVYELLGLNPKGRASHERLMKHVDPRDIESLNQLIEKSLAEGSDFQAEFRLIRHNGETTWVASRGKAVRGVARASRPRSEGGTPSVHEDRMSSTQGKTVRMLGILFDITRRKQMEDDLRRLNDQLGQEVQAQTEELQDNIERLQDEVARRVQGEGQLRNQGRLLDGFFQHTITPLAFLDAQFNFVQVNEAYAEAAGKAVDFFKGKNHFTLYPHKENRAIFEEVVRTGEPYRAFAKAFTYPDRPHRVTYWDWLLTPLRNEQGEVQYLVLNLQDVTQRQEAVDELEHRAFQLQKLALELSLAEERERRRMAEVLHDGLQQQLAAAKFHLGLLGARARSDQALAEMAAQLDQMLRDAIEQSRSLSHDLSPAVLYQSDLGETFEWLARQVQTKHGLTVHVEVHGRPDSQSESIKTFLFRSGQEILFNAVKHAKAQEARLRLQRRGERLCLTIADQGQGFDPKAVGRSAGFGLLSIRERVGLLGGRMKIHSAPGRGSAFLITVPDAQAAEETKETADGRPEAGGTPATAYSLPPTASGCRLRVLLVDDHKVMREGLAALIGEQEDMEVVGHAGDGGEAIQRARELQPDVIVLDVAMPVMPGDEAARRIKAEMPHLRIVALSMFTEPGVREKMLDAGAEDYLPKTGPSEELIAAIRG